MTRPALALVDCNNFYASSEQLFTPSLQGRVLVVLSNNDGCIVARSRAAKLARVPMGKPLFQVADQLRWLGAEIRSSNYELYGALSARVMQLLQQECPAVEVYSIDEAFVRWGDRPDRSRSEEARRLRARIAQWTGIPVAIGIGHTKVQAKLANHLAKKWPDAGGVFDLTAQPDPDVWLARVPVADIWGIGPAYHRWCEGKGLRTALDFRDAPAGMVKQKLGIVGRRLQLELQGIPCLELELTPPERQETCCSRSFGDAVTDLESLRSAVAFHTEKAAAKLRRQGQKAGRLTVFARSSPFRDPDRFYSRSASCALEPATHDTGRLLRHARELTREIFQPGVEFRKAGVLLQELNRSGQQQLGLWSSDLQPERPQLMALVDRLNREYGPGTIRFAAAGLAPGPWQMRREHRSERYLTDWQGLPQVLATE